MELKNYFVIVATETENVYFEIAKQLEDLGLIEYKNYLPVWLIDRELAILYGNCHMIKLEKYLQKQPEFTRKYYIRRYYVAALDKNKRVPSDHDLKYCRLLISQDIRDDNSLSVPGIKEIRGELQTIANVL